MTFNPFVKFNCRLSKNLYLFDIYSLNKNNMTSYIIGYGLVDINTREKYCSTSTNNFIYQSELNKLGNICLTEADSISEFFSK